MRMLWIVGGLVGSLVLLAAIVAGVGTMLPKDHVARGSAVVAAPPEMVARLVGAVEEHPRWRPGVAIEDVVRREGVVDYVEVSGGDRIAYRLTAEPGGRSFTSRIIDDSLPFGGSWTIVLAPEGGGTRVSIEERGEVRHPVYRFVSAFLIGHERSIKAYLKALEAAPHA